MEDGAAEGVLCFGAWVGSGLQGLGFGWQDVPPRPQDAGRQGKVEHLGVVRCTWGCRKIGDPKVGKQDPQEGVPLTW